MEVAISQAGTQAGRQALRAGEQAGRRAGGQPGSQAARQPDSQTARQPGRGWEALHTLLPVQLEDDVALFAPCVADSLDQRPATEKCGTA